MNNDIIAIETYVSTFMDDYVPVFNRIYFKPMIVIPFIILFAFFMLSLSYSFAGQARTLYQAIEENDQAMFTQLLQSGADPNTKDLLGNTTLHNLSRHGLVDWMKPLLEYKANPSVQDNMGRTPLHVTPFPESIELLLQHRADPDRVDYKGNTVLQVAILLEYEKAAQFWLKKFPEFIDRPNTKNKKTALMMAMEIRHKNLVALLLKHGASITARDNNGYSPIIYAVKNHLLYLVTSVKNDVDFQPILTEDLVSAIKMRDYKIIEYLLRVGIDPNTRDKAQTPLQLAMAMKDKKIIELFSPYLPAHYKSKVK